MRRVRTDRDCRAIDAVSAGLVDCEGDDTADRLRALIEGGESEDKLQAACEIAVSWIRFAQDLKNKAEENRRNGYM